MPVWLSNPEILTPKPNYMNPVPVGNRIQIISNNNAHQYRVGGIYRVHQIDNDGTLKAIDDMGVEGDYLIWDDCQLVGMGWKWIREHLDARSLDLLSAFHGLENLSLRQDVETKVITTIPNLADQILEILPEVELQIARLTNPVVNDDADDDLDDDLKQLLTR